MAQPEDIGGEYDHSRTAQDQQPGRQLGDEGNEYPHAQRENKPAEEKRAKEPSGLQAISRIGRRSHAQCCYVPHDVTMYPRSCSFEACCCDLASSVMSGAAEKVPTGGELTLFEAVDRVAG